MCSYLLFFFTQPLIFTLVALAFLIFLPPLKEKIHVFLPNEIGLLCFLSLALTLSLLSSSMKTLTTNLVERKTRLCCCLIFLSTVRVAMLTARVLETQNFTPSLHESVDVAGITGALRAKRGERGILRETRKECEARDEGRRKIKHLLPDAKSIALALPPTQNTIHYSKIITFLATRHKTLGNNKGKITFNFARAKSPSIMYDSVRQE